MLRFIGFLALAYLAYHFFELEVLDAYLSILESELPL